MAALFFFPQPLSYEFLSWELLYGGSSLGDEEKKKLTLKCTVC